MNYIQIKYEFIKQPIVQLRQLSRFLVSLTMMVNPQFDVCSFSFIPAEYHCYHLMEFFFAPDSIKLLAPSIHLQRFARDWHILLVFTTCKMCQSLVCESLANQCTVGHNLAKTYKIIYDFLKIFKPFKKDIDKMNTFEHFIKSSLT